MGIDSHIRPVCSLQSMHLCTASQKLQIKELQAMSSEQLARMIASEERRKQRVEKQATERFNDGVLALKQRHSELLGEKEAAIAKVKKGIRFIQEAHDSSN